MRGLDQEGMRQFLASYQDLGNSTVHATWVPFVFYFFTLGVNFWVVSKGLSGGIEKLAKIGMPVLFIFAAILVVRALTLPPEASGRLRGGTLCKPSDGLNFMYTPDWAALSSQGLLAARADLLHLSVRRARFHTSPRRTTSRFGIATAATNETAEVVLARRRPAMLFSACQCGGDRPRQLTRSSRCPLFN
jgi:SNF family Na+-dependent transporter